MCTHIHTGSWTVRLGCHHLVPRLARHSGRIWRDPNSMHVELAPMDVEGYGCPLEKLEDVSILILGYCSNEFVVI